LLLAGVLFQQGKAKVDNLVAAVLDDLPPNADLAAQARAAGLLGAIFHDLAAVEYEPSDDRYARLLENVMGIFDRQRSTRVPIETRIAAADALGQAGDPRIDMRRDDYWVTIPTGKFWMGAQSKNTRKPNYDPEAQDRESPVHEVELDEFKIAKYPVAVSQYQQFVEHDGCQDQRWWSAGGFGEFSEPGRWEDQLQFPNRPVTDVSWYEAAAFCSWANSWLPGCRLPTEAEWERAARGTDGRKFPWGIEPADPSRLNFESSVGHATPVGIYPLGATPEGICDMAGNVWEWCWDRYGEDYYGRSPPRNPRGPDDGEYGVLRGGAWSDLAAGCRAAIRGGDHPQVRDCNVGFRVLVCRQNSP
jgi:formylglycine-generating enzyme required for sulfatase activity